MKSKLVLSAEEARLEPTAVMGNESGIYFTFMSDLAVIADILPEPLEPAFPLVSGYVVKINNPSFGEPYKEAMLGVYVKVNGVVGMYVYGTGGGQTVIMDERSTLAKIGVNTMPGHRLIEIKEHSIVVADNADIEIEIECDSVVVSLGVKSENPYVDTLKDMDNVYVIGEADAAGRRIGDAVHAAYQLAYRL